MHKYCVSGIELQHKQNQNISIGEVTHFYFLEFMISKTALV